MDFILATLYGGFFALDVRLLLFLSLVALLAATGTVMAVKRLRWGRPMIPWVAVGFVAYLVLLVLVFNYIVDYPVLVIRSFFKIK